MNLKLWVWKMQPGSTGMVMESCKAAPALRARPLRSYVPLRRVPSESVLSGTIPVLPGGNFLHPQIQFLLCFWKMELVIFTVLSICSCSSLLFPSFIISRIRLTSSGENRIPCLFAFVIRASIMGASSRPDFPEVLDAAILISSSLAGSIPCI